MTETRKERRDVVRHRNTILDAAERVFAEHGAFVPLEQVAKAADVGRATLYRHFPDRRALFLGIFERTVEPILKEGFALPPEDILLGVVHKLARAARKSPQMEDAWRIYVSKDPELQARRHSFLRQLETPLADAKAAGKVRSDLTLEDLVAVLRMAVAAQSPQLHDDSYHERLMKLLLEGIGGHH
ncbi:TetR/AcrR family transcriptional regulator [Vreelandella olivaria]|uniref:TetR/AcrR family transcriptional regulator n=1 Tax=Vreelandella olivaria TaxID=390919 RepID=UPI00201F52DD|nr:TetR/AcrR family transcriptional regulator [Halomonas olivaria]